MADQARGIAYPLYVLVNAARAEMGWDWTRLKEKSGVARSTINKWQTIQTAPRPGTVNAVADALGIPRLKALTLAGIVAEPIPEDAPLCTMERSILARDVPDGEKARAIREHREGDHGRGTVCLPLAEAEESRHRAVL